MAKSKAVFFQVICRLRQTLQQQKLLPTSERILVALSGGQDSLALTESLRHLHQRDRWDELSLVHCDHRWPHDEGNADFVRRYAAKLRLPLHVIDAAHCAMPVGFTESAAREWRYRQLAQLAQDIGFDAVVTAHTRTDLAETVIFNLTSGAGADGLAAMTWERTLCEGVRLVRPFLDISREQTGAFCRERGIEVWNDFYNSDTRYTRNHIRANIMPILRESLNAHVEVALARTAHLLRDENCHLENEVDKIYAKVVSASERQEDIEYSDTKPPGVGIDQKRKDVVALRRKELFATSIAIQRRVIRRLLRDYFGLSHKGATFAQVETIRFLLTKDVGSSVPSISGHASALVADEETIVLTSCEQFPNEPHRLQPNSKLELRPSTAMKLPDVSNL